MSKVQKIIVYGVLIFIAVGLLAGGYFYYSMIKFSPADPINAIPRHTAVFFELQSPLQTLEYLESENELWHALKALRQFSIFHDEIVNLDYIIRQNEEIKSLFTDNKLILSVHQNPQDKVELLIIFTVDPSTGANRIDDFILNVVGENYKAHSSAYGKADIVNVMRDKETCFCYTVHKGLFTGSHSLSLLKASIDQLENGKSLECKTLEKLKSTAGKKVDANIYIQHEHFNHLIQYLAGTPYQDCIASLGNMGLWTETDLIVKRDELLLNGYTEAIDSMPHYLNIFSSQMPQEIGMTRVLPYNTNFILCLGIEQFDDYFTKYSDYRRLHEGIVPLKDKLDLINQHLEIDIVQSLGNWIGNEMALVIAGYAGSEQSLYSIFQIRDKEGAEEALSRYAAGDPVIYKDYIIRQTIGGHSIPAIFGRIFQGDEQSFFTVIEDYVVFAANPAKLEQFINIFLSGKTLKRNENFKDFADNLSDRSNIFIYLNIRNSIGLMGQYLDPSFAGLISNNSNVFSNFEGLAAQFSLSHGMFYTSIYAKYNPAYIQEDLSIWKLVLDADIQGHPYFVKDHRTNTLKIIVFDKDHQMYMIDHNGQIIWKIPIGEAVISAVYPVDYYRNGKIQYLFNTESNIYLIDLLGRPVSGFPLRLSPKATNGLSVFDYEGNRNYRILIALEDNRVYNYDLQGLPIRGWKKPMAKEVVRRPIEHVRMLGKDYLIASDIKGQVMVLNRRGEHRVNLKEDYLQANHSAFYPNRTNSAKGIILTTDYNGKLTYIKANGKIEQSDFGDFSPDHYFLYEDFDNNGHKDFIYLDGNELVVYDRFKETVMQHSFKNEIVSSPVIIPVSENKNIIGIVSDATRKIYLFDDEGNLVSTPDMIGKTQILVGSLLNNGQLNLIVGSGNTLYNYYFQ